MFIFLKKIFTPPVFDDEIKTHQAYLLHIIVWCLILVPIPYVTYTIFKTPEYAARALMQAVFGETINFFLLFLIHRGFVHTAAIVQIISLWIFFTVSSVTGASVQGEAYLLGYPLVIVVAGILTNGRITFGVTALSLIVGGAMVYAEAQNKLVITNIGNSMTIWVVSLVVFPMGMVMQYLSRRTVENALKRARASEEKYRLISQVSSDYTFTAEVHKNGSVHLSWVAGAFEKMTGYTFEEYINSGSWAAHVHPDDLEKDAQDMENLYKNQDIKSEIRTFTKHGELRWEQVFAHPVWDEKENRLIGIFGAVRDITEQKKIETALAHERDLLRIFMDNIPDLVYFKDRESRFERINQAHARFLGVATPQDALGKTDLDFQTPEFAQEFLLEEKKIMESGLPVWNRLEFNPIEDGKPAWFSTTKVPAKNEFGQIIGTIGISRNITAQKQSEAALAYERDLLQIFMDNIPDQVYFKDAESRFVRINQAQTRFLKLENSAAAIGKTDLDFQNSDIAREFMVEEKQIIETGQSILNRIEFNPTSDGKPRWLSATKVPVRDSAGQIIGTIGISRDVSEQKEAQENLQRIFLQQAAILNNIPDMAWLKDNDSRYIAINEQFAITAGMEIRDIIGKTDLDIWGKDFAERYRVDDLEVIRTRQRRNTEELQLDGMGREYWVETTKTPILNTSGEVIGTTGLAREITERKKAQESEQKRRQMLEKVVQLGKRVAESDNLRSTIKKIWHGVHDDLGFDRLAIFLFNAERNTMDDTVGTNNNGEMVDHWQISYPVGSIFATLLQNPDGVYFTNNYDVENAIPKEHEMYGIKDYLAVAAWAGDKPVAVICVDHGITQLPITADQLEALRLFGGYAGLAIENSRLHEAVQNELAHQKRAKEREEERRALLEKVIKLGQYVTEVNDLHTTLTRIWNGVHHDLKFDRTAIFLYDPEAGLMNGTFGTNDQGEMIVESHLAFSMDDKTNPEVRPFIHVLERPDTIYSTHNFEQNFNIPAGHIMSGVKDFASIATWAGEKPVAFISVDHKITGRPIAEEQLEALRLFAGYAGLSIENARLNGAIQNELAQRKKINENLEAKNAELERFTYTVSHDLKSPLVTIKGFLGYLERDSLEGDYQKFKQDVSRIETAVEKMQNLLKDLLELSRIGRLINPPVDIAFNEIVADALEIVHGQIEEKNVTIEFKHNNEIMQCDRTRMVEVLQNLIDNAIKFMSSQTDPRIEIGTYKNEKNISVYYVKDNGIGIDPQFHENIFGLFNKLDTGSSGTGIGLALVKRIIEVHGGQIWVESQVGVGTTFYFTLP